MAQNAKDYYGQVDHSCVQQHKHRVMHILPKEMSDEEKQALLRTQLEALERKNQVNQPDPKNESSKDEPPKDNPPQNEPVNNEEPPKDNPPVRLDPRDPDVVQKAKAMGLDLSGIDLSAFQQAPPPDPIVYQERFMRPAPVLPELPIVSSAVFQYVPSDDDVVITADTLRRAQYIINLAHNANLAADDLKRMAVDTFASDKKWADSILSEAGKIKKVGYDKKTFYFFADVTGKPRGFSGLYPSTEEAIKALGPERVHDMKQRNVKFEKLISSVEWYVDKNGNRIQPVAKGEPKTPAAKLEVSAHLVQHGAEYIYEYHDTHHCPDELKELLKQVLLTDEHVLAAAKAERTRREIAKRPPTMIGYYIKDINRPYRSEAEAEDAYWDDVKRRMGDDYVEMLRQGDGDMNTPSIRAWVYYADNGRLGKPLEDHNLAYSILAERFPEYADQIKKKPAKATATKSDKSDNSDKSDKPDKSDKATPADKK